MLSWFKVFRSQYRFFIRFPIYSGVTMAFCKQLKPAIRSVYAHGHTDANNVHSCLHESQFQKFASREYRGKLFMTGEDLLKSLLLREPTFRGRECLDENEFHSKLAHVTKFKGKSSNFFRDMGPHLLITYTEYLFLLSVLSKPVSSHEIAFKMFDKDRSNSIDVEEFKALNKVLASTTDENSLNSEVFCDSSLVSYLFGPMANNKLTFDKFKDFLLAFTDEILEMEFYFYSKSQPLLPTIEFAKIVMNYTKLPNEQKRDAIEQLKQLQQHGISLEEFKSFFYFLASLEDFALAMRMYTISGRPISKTEFKRAVKACTGKEFTKNLTRTIFIIFDRDEDRLLGQKEFLPLVKRNISRGLIHISNDRDKFKETFARCLKRNRISHFD